MPFAVSAATLPRNSAFIELPRSRYGNDMQHRFAAYEAVDIARRIGAAPACHALGPGRTMRRHDYIRQFVKRMPRRPNIRFLWCLIAPPRIERRAADDA